jgi:hypothetical protein
MAKKPPTKSERAHLDAVSELGCLVCRAMGYWSPALIHHVRTIQGQRITRNHAYVLPLCPMHHSADYKTGFHTGSRSWQRLHGSEESLLELVQQLLTEAA